MRAYLAGLLMRSSTTALQVRHYNGQTAEISIPRPKRTLESPVAVSLEERERGKVGAPRTCQAGWRISQSRCFGIMGSNPGTHKVSRGDEHGCCEPGALFCPTRRVRRIIRLWSRA